MPSRLQEALGRIVTDEEELSKPCRPCWEFDDEELASCARDLLATARILDTGKIKCAGLAANQLGYRCRMFVVKNPRGKFVVYEEPEILGVSAATKLSTEGCFSRPGASQKVVRSVTIQVRANNPPKVRTLVGLEAVAFQHETDHLDGRLI